ncbi:MAG TPA: glycosyltransferase [Candidatus Paceibacterota bacterium]|nr:glycosyltransferase [Candidatus Paceibacterota bacterium]
MKVAVLHDYLNQYGGAERVLEVILEMFPEADLYTLLYDPEELPADFEDNFEKASALNNRLVNKNHRLFIPFMPMMAERLSSDKDYDLIVSSSAGYGKGIGVEGDFHVCYCHTPLRYAWEFNELGSFSFSPWAFSGVFKPVAEYLRKWDKKVSEDVNVFVANSSYISDKIDSYYERDSHVIYPPVDITQFYPEPGSLNNHDGYYLMVGRFLYYKLFDLGIRVFNKLGIPLKIVGSGPEEKKLRKIAGGNIEFLSNVSDDELREIYSNAKGFIFPQVEDFGLVAAEAQACGLPVVAYNAGGAKEIVEEDKTGVLFDEQTEEYLVDAVKRFEKMKFDRKYIARRAEKFSVEKFKENFFDILKNQGFDF